jgi:hypothetical protein
MKCLILKCISFSFFFNFEMYSHCVGMFDLSFFQAHFVEAVVVASLCLGMLSIKSENLVNLKWIEVRKNLVFRFGSLESIMPY